MTDPMLLGPETAITDSLFDAVRPKRVLEFGPGGTTEHWSPRDCVEEWVAVEHQERFRKAIANLPKVQALLCSFPQYWEDQVGTGPFNLILVDGRERVRCLEVASKLLAPLGIVILHDSCRMRYEPAWDFFKHSATLSPGSQHNVASGITVFWQDDDVDTDAWIWEHAPETHQFWTDCDPPHWSPEE